MNVNNNLQSTIVLYNELDTWTANVYQRGLQIQFIPQLGKDPYEHWYAYNDKGVMFGYYGDANSMNASHGFIADNEYTFNCEMGII